MSELCLKSVSVRGQVTGKFAAFAVEQTYENQSDTVLEVTYCFPLSRTATVTGFRALAGDKEIHGVVKEKFEARKEYQQALVRGNSAYMATNEGSNIFQMAIGKIAAGETVRVTLDYIDILDVLDMKIRLVVPMLVAPRYTSETTEPLQYNSEEVKYRATIEITFNPALEITDFDSPSHTIKIRENTVIASNIKLNRDFVLEATLQEKSATAAWQYPLKNGNRLLYLSFLPLLSQNTERQPRDFVFVIDVSGSMEGEKFRQTKEAVRKCLQSLSAKDRFNIITFASNYRVYNNELIDVTNENLSKAMDYVAGLVSGGGTEMESPVHEAIEKFGDGKIIFFFTDGQIGYEERIANYVREKISKNSLFIFGIDTSVNMSGLEKIAKAGRGKADFIVNEDQIKPVVTAQFARATNNKLWEVDINGKSNCVLEKIERQSVIFDNEPYDVLLEVEKEVRDDVALVCRCGDGEHVFGIKRDAIQASNLPLDKIYYAEKIRKIEQYFSHDYRADNSGYEKEIVAIAVENQIDSKYTAFIAVNERDEKITDVPVGQNIVLEEPAEWENQAVFRQKAKPSLIVKGAAYLEGPRKLFKRETPTDWKRKLYKKPEVNEEDVQKQIKETLARLANKVTNSSKGFKSRREKLESKVLKLTAEFVTANDLASMMEIPVAEVISTCMSIGIMVSINQHLDAETINIVADEFGFKTEYVSTDNVWIDEFGVKYSADRKKLISCPYNCNLTTYTINAGCEVICDKAFYGCSRLTTLIIPNSVKAIGEMAFFGCNNLTTIYVSWEDPTIVSGLIHFPDKAVFYLPYGIRVDWYKRMGMKTATARLTELHPINSVTE